MRNLIIQFDKKESLIIKLFRIFGLLSSLMCVLLTVLNNAQFNLWILPVTYSLGMILLGDNNEVKFTPGIITLNIVMFVRYVILPTIMSISASPLSVYAKQYDYIEEAVIIMWIELLGILAAIYFTGMSFKKRNCEILSVGDSFHFTEMKYGNIISLSGIVFIVVMIIRYPYLIGGIELLTQGYLSNASDVSDVSGLVGIVWKSLTIWLGIYFLFKLKKRDFAGSKLSVFIVLAIILIVLLSFIGQTTISRWYSVVTFCAIYFSAIKMFPDRSKRITIWTIIPVIAFLFITSIYKNTDYLQAEEGMLRYIKELFDITTLDAYFAGPSSVNNAIHMKEQGELGLFSIFYDLLRNFPVLNHYIDVGNSTVGAYALYLGRGDQILPLVGQSMIYFGYLFTPFLSIVSVILLRYFDYQYLKSNSLSMYIYAFVACWLGLASILNLTICISWFYVTIIPAFLLIRFTEIVNNQPS